MNFSYDVQARNSWTRKLISVNNTYGGNFSHQSLLCFARTRLHLCADNRPWKENYNQSRGREEGTAHALQPNILIYKESIKYLKSKVASQSAHWWLDWGISVYFNSLILFISGCTSVCYVFISSLSSFSLLFFSLFSLSLCLFHLRISVLSQLLCQFSSCESILVNIVLPCSSFRTHTLQSFSPLTD